MSRSVDAILQSIDFIEENLQNELTVLEVSRRACYSVYHFIRLFEGVTGHTPKDYILRRRIAEAARELADPRKKIIDVCFDYQFGSPEVFSRAFKRLTGIPPGEMQKSDYFSRQSLLTRIDRDSIHHGENLRECECEEISLDTIHLGGMVTLIREDKEIISELWGYMYHELPGLEETPEPGRFYGHSFWSDRYDLKGFFLLCGVSLPSPQPLPAPLCARTVPPGKYLKFIHRGDVRTIRLTYKYIFETYLPRTDWTLSRPYDFEIYTYDGGRPDAPEGRTEILIPVD